MTAPRPPQHAEVVEVLVDPVDLDLVSGALWAAGAVAIAEEPDGDRVLLRSAPAEGVSPSELAHGVAAWSHALVGAPPVVRVRRVVDDGLDAWRAHAAPWRAGTHLVVWPAWRPTDDPGLGWSPRPGDVVVRIDPGHAFGSGSHPSTRLALAALEAVLRPGADVLDVGCGSGVLAVAAAILGAGAVVATDVDGEALAATSANAAANDVDDRIEVRPTPLARLVADGCSADVVLANILAPVLCHLGPDLAAATRPGGHLVVAGVLGHQLDDVVAAIGLPLTEVHDEDGWACATLRRPSRVAAGGSSS